MDKNALLAAIYDLEREAYMHGLRNGAPSERRSMKTLLPLPERGIREPVGKPHHEARARVEQLVDTLFTMEARG